MTEFMLISVLLTVIEFTKRQLDTKHSTPDCKVTEYVQKLQVNSPGQVVTKRVLLTQTNFDLSDLEKLGQIKNLGIHVMYPY
jgi:hypothetical protein